MKKVRRQELIDLVDGAAIFSAGGGGDPEVGYKIVDALSEGGYEVVNLINRNAAETSLVSGAGLGSHYVYIPRFCVPILQHSI